MIKRPLGNEDVPGDVVGVGTIVPGRFSGEAFRRKYNVSDPTSSISADRRE